MATTVFHAINETTFCRHIRQRANDSLSPHRCYPTTTLSMRFHNHPWMRRFSWFSEEHVKLAFREFSVGMAATPFALYYSRRRCKGAGSWITVRTRGVRSW